jgi:hypothetical protein
VRAPLVMVACRADAQDSGRTGRGYARNSPRHGPHHVFAPRTTGDCRETLEALV